MNLYWSLAVAFVSMFASWEVHTWYDGYKTKNEAIVAEQHAAKGETKIIADTQTIQKEIKNAKKDNCFDEYIPAPVLKQLQ
jgi:hypothetical protein